MEPSSLNRKLKREEFEEKPENNEEKDEHSEKAAESSEENDEETIDAEEMEMRKEVKKKTEEMNKKRREIFELKENLKFKEEEIELDEKEMETYEKKDRIRIIRKKIEENKKKLKDLYVHQLNLENCEYDEEDPDDVDGMWLAKEDVKKKIYNLETENEELKNFAIILAEQVTKEKAKILEGRAKIGKERKDFEVAKEIRKKEIEEEEKGEWPGEPRWY